MTALGVYWLILFGCAVAYFAAGMAVIGWMRRRYTPVAVRFMFYVLHHRHPLLAWPQLLFDAWLWMGRR